MLVCRCCLQFERACKEVLQDDHQLTAEGEEQHFEDVQVCANLSHAGQACSFVGCQTLLVVHRVHATEDKHLCTAHKCNYWCCARKLSCCLSLQHYHCNSLKLHMASTSCTQVLLYSSQPFGPSSMRELNSNRVSQLVQISGIITSASKPKVCISKWHAGSRAAVH